MYLICVANAREYRSVFFLPNVFDGVLIARGRGSERSFPRTCPGVSEASDSRSVCVGTDLTWIAITVKQFVAATTAFSRVINHWCSGCNVDQMKEAILSHREKSTVGLAPGQNRVTRMTRQNRCLSDRLTEEI